MKSAVAIAPSNNCAAMALMAARQRLVTGTYRLRDTMFAEPIYATASFFIRYR